jgi:hypothetical protein
LHPLNGDSPQSHKARTIFTEPSQNQRGRLAHNFDTVIEVRIAANDSE